MTALSAETGLGQLRRTFPLDCRHFEDRLHECSNGITKDRSDSGDAGLASAWRKSIDRLRRRRSSILKLALQPG